MFCNGTNEYRERIFILPKLEYNDKSPPQPFLCPVFVEENIV